MDKGTYIETKYINAYCQTKNYQHYIIRVDHYTQGWYMVSGFIPVAESQKKKHITIFSKTSKRVSNTTQEGLYVEKSFNFDGGIFTGDTYSCPYCGNKKIVKCGKCGKACCSKSISFYFRCVCGNKGPISGTIQSLRTISGGLDKIKKK